MAIHKKTKKNYEWHKVTTRE